MLGDPIRGAGYSPEAVRASLFQNPFAPFASRVSLVLRHAVPLLSLNASRKLSTSDARLEEGTRRRTRYLQHLVRDLLMRVVDYGISNTIHGSRMSRQEAYCRPDHQLCRTTRLSTDRVRNRATLTNIR